MDELLKALNIELEPPGTYHQTHRLFDLWERTHAARSKALYSIPMTPSNNKVIEPFREVMMHYRQGCDAAEGRRHYPTRRECFQRVLQLADHVGVDLVYFSGMYPEFTDGRLEDKLKRSRFYFLTNKLSSSIFELPSNMSRYMNNTEYMIETMEILKYADKHTITDWSIACVDSSSGKLYCFVMPSAYLFGNEDSIENILWSQYRYYYLGIPNRNRARSDLSTTLCGDRMITRPVRFRGGGNGLGLDNGSRLKEEEKHRLLRHTIIDAIGPKPISYTKPVIFSISPYIELVESFYDPSRTLEYPAEFYRPTFDMRIYDHEPLEVDCPEYLHFIKIGLIVREHLVEFIDTSLNTRGYDYAVSFVRPLLKLSKINHRYFVYFLSRIYQSSIPPEVRETIIDDYCETVLLKVPGIGNEQSDVFRLLKEFKEYRDGAGGLSGFFESKGYLPIGLFMTDATAVPETTKTTVLSLAKSTTPSLGLEDYRTVDHRLRKLNSVVGASFAAKHIKDWYAELELETVKLFQGAGKHYLKMKFTSKGSEASCMVEIVVPSGYTARGVRGIRFAPVKSSNLPDFVKVTNEHFKNHRATLKDALNHLVMLFQEENSFLSRRPDLEDDDDLFDEIDDEIFDVETGGTHPAYAHLATSDVVDSMICRARQTQSEDILVEHVKPLFLGDGPLVGLGVAHAHAIEEVQAPWGSVESDKPDNADGVDVHPSKIDETTSFEGESPDISDITEMGLKYLNMRMDDLVMIAPMKASKHYANVSVPAVSSVKEDCTFNKTIIEQTRSESRVGNRPPETSDSSQSTTLDSNRTFVVPNITSADPSILCTDSNYLSVWWVFWAVVWIVFYLFMIDQLYKSYWSFRITSG